MPFAKLIELAKTALPENKPLAEVLQQLRASGYKITDAPGGKWTLEQERALAAIITMDNVRRVWMGSLEITELIRRQLQHEMFSMPPPMFSLPTSPMGAISSFSSLSSPFGGRERGRLSFWFNETQELIIFGGATEPDAQVTIGGRGSSGGRTERSASGRACRMANTNCPPWRCRRTSRTRARRSCSSAGARNTAEKSGCNLRIRN